MKVGMIFECGRKGADGKVYPCLAKKIRDDLDINPEFLDNKTKLIEECGEVAKFLIEEKNCEKVVIIWDFFPFWGEPNPCIAQDCQRIQTVFADAQLTSQQREKIHLICVKQELETFLLMDEIAINDYLKKLNSHPCQVQCPKKPAREPNPKRFLKKIFIENGRIGYDDLVDAVKIAELIDIKKLKKHKAFERFEKTIRLL